MTTITTTDIAHLRSLLGDEFSYEADRGRFYLEVAELYRETDAFEQVMIQAEITTYSGAIGGSALLGNHHAQQHGGDKYDVTLDEFSWEIADRFLEAMEKDITQFDGSSVFSSDQIQLLDYSVWHEKGIGDLFPGNIQLLDELIVNTPTDQGMLNEFFDGKLNTEDLAGAYLTSLPEIGPFSHQAGSSLSDFGFTPDAGFGNGQFFLDLDEGDIVRENTDFILIGDNHGETLVVESKTTGNIVAVFHEKNLSTVNGSSFSGSIVGSALNDYLGFGYSTEEIDRIKNSLGAHLNNDGLRYVLDKTYQPEAFGVWDDVKERVNNALEWIKDTLDELFIPPPPATPPPTPGSPLALDLDGDGIETTELDSAIYFDHNGDGIINNGSELFGNATRLADGSLADNGFTALADLDSDHDGEVDQDDTEFDQLRVFRDLNQNGHTDDGELFTLVDVGVNSLSVAYTEQNHTDTSGNEHRQVGSYSDSNGKTQAMTDVWFARDITDTQGEQLDLSLEVALLPDARGFGVTHSLHQTMYA